MDEVRSFQPVVDHRSRVLILGSMPGVESLRKQQYYAHPRNHFWQIIYGLFGRAPDASYEKRLDFILDQGLALWDVIEKCEREGSLDANIKNERANKIKELLTMYPNIRTVVFNGTKAYDTYRKKIGFATHGQLDYKRLPSTSPIPGKNIKTYAEKLEVWKIIRDYL